jgi:hypothetical protein
MAKRKNRSPSAKRSSGKRSTTTAGGLSFDPAIRTDKLRAWLDNHPGEIPPGLTSERCAELLSGE